MDTVSRTYIVYLVERTVQILSGIGLLLLILYFWFDFLGSPWLNIMASCILVLGSVACVFAFLRPYEGIFLFIWVSCFVDFFKRVAYQFPPFTFYEVQRILIVPFLIMFAMYIRVLLLHWFGREDQRIPVRYGHYWLVIAFGLATGTAFVGGHSLSFSSIATNIQWLFYIPAAIAVPYLLFNPSRWRLFSIHCLLLLLIVGTYGVSQSLLGYFPFERDYLESGMTTTGFLLDVNLVDRAFSTLNASSTYTGVLCLLAFYSLFWICRRQGRFVLNAYTILLCLSVFAACILATQRGAPICFLAAVGIIALSSRPRLLTGIMLLMIAGYVSMIVFAAELKVHLYTLDGMLEPLRFNDFTRQTLTLLTFGERLDSYELLANPELWKPFGSGFGASYGGHDLVTNLLVWSGYVGLFFFVGAMIVVIKYGLDYMRLLQKGTDSDALLWIQVNLGCFLFMLIWGFLLGSSIHVSPMNFFFWLSLGNIVYTKLDYPILSVQRLITWVRQRTTRPRSPIQNPQ